MNTIKNYIKCDGDDTVAKIFLATAMGIGIFGFIASIVVAVYAAIVGDPAGWILAGLAVVYAGVIALVYRRMKSAIKESEEV